MHGGSFIDVILTLEGPVSVTAVVFLVESIWVYYNTLQNLHLSSPPKRSGGKTEEFKLFSVHGTF